MTLDELVADLDTGLRHLINGMGFTEQQATHLYALLVDEHATDGGSGLPTAPGQAGAWPGRRVAVRAPGPHSTPAAGPGRTVDRRRYQLTVELTRAIWWTLISWWRCRRRRAW